MDKNELRRALVRAAVHKGIKEIRSDPERGLRKLVDLGSHFAKGRFQTVIFQLMHEQMIHEDSGYHRLAKRIITEAQPKVLEDFGINIGYNSWTEGARRIRRHEEMHGYNVPWCILMDLTCGAQFDLDDLMRQGEKLGICCYFLFAGSAAQTAAIYPVLHKHKDSAVFLMASDDALPCINMENVTNVLYVLPKSGKHAKQQAEALRRCGCCCGVWESYDEGNIENLLCGADEAFVQQIGAMSLFTLQKQSESGEKVRGSLRDYVLESRKKAQYSCFTVDMMEDIRRIDSIISMESCMLAIGSDGSVVSMQNKHESLNVRCMSLEEILKNTMPKVTYLKEKE